MAKEYMTMDEYAATLVGGNMKAKGMARGGKVGMKKKGYAKGGKVRGCGIATRGVRKAKMVTMKGS